MADNTSSNMHLSSLAGPGATPRDATTTLTNANTASPAPRISAPTLYTRTSDNTTTTTTTTRSVNIAGPVPAASATTAPELRMTASDMFAELMQAISQDRVDRVARLLEAGAVLNEVNTDGEAPLHLATRNGSMALVGLLLQHGARVDFSWRDSPSAETIAAEEARVLRATKHGAKVNLHTCGAPTALRLAAQEGHLEIATLLLKHGADVNFVRGHLGTALACAANKGYVELAALLLKHGAKVDLTSFCSYTPLAEAAEYGHLELVALLLKNGAKAHLAHARNSFFPTPLCMAARNGHVDIVSALILQNKKDLAAHGFFAHGPQDISTAYVDEPTSQTPLYLAIDEGHLAAAAVLIASGARVDLPDKRGNTALLCAVKHNDIQALALLLQTKSNVLHKNNDGQTALGLALSSSDASSLLIDMLLEAKASSGQTNSSLFCAGKKIDLATLADQACALSMNLRHAETNEQASAWRTLINNLCTMFGILHIVAEGYATGLKQMPAYWPGLDRVAIRPTEAQVRMFYRHALASAQRLHALANEEDRHRTAIYQSQFTPPGTVTLIRLAARQSHALIADSENALRQWEASLGRVLAALPPSTSAAEVEQRLQCELGLHPSLAACLSAIWDSLETRSTPRLIQAMHQEFNTAEFASMVIEPINNDMLRFMLMEQLKALFRL